MRKRQLGFLGALIGGALGFLGARSQNKASAAQARAQMSFQEEMSNTSYQRAVADMAAAGLNPMLAYSQGGASTPGGAQAPMQNELSAGVSSAAQYLTTQNIEKQNELIEAQTDETHSKAELNRALVPKAVQEVDTSSAHAAKMRQETLTEVERAKEVIARVKQLHYQSILTEEEAAKVRTLIWNNNITYEILKAELGTAKADAVIRNLEIPHARNLSEAEKTEFKKRVSPYLRDVETISGAAQDIGSARFNLRRSVKPFVKPIVRGR